MMWVNSVPLSCRLARSLRELFVAWVLWVFWEPSKKRTWLLIRFFAGWPNARKYHAELCFVWERAELLKRGIGFVHFIAIFPIFHALKTTYVISEAKSLWDVISLTGGMFTALYSIITLFTIYLIWGLDCCHHKIKFNGLANQSDPSDIEKLKKIKTICSKMYWFNCAK